MKSRQISRRKTRSFLKDCSLALSLAVAVIAIGSFTGAPGQAKNQYGMPTALELRDELAACRKKYGNKDQRTAKALEDLAHCWELSRQSYDEERLKALIEALPIRKATYDPEKFSSAFGQAGVVNNNVAGAEYALDLWHIGQMLQLRRVAKRNGAMQAKSGKSGVTLQIGLQDLNAVDIWKELVEMSEKSLGREHGTTVDFMLHLATAENSAEDYKEAETTALKAISIEEKRNLPRDKYSRLFWALTTLEHNYVDMEKDKKAEPVIIRQIAYLKECDPEGPFMAGTLEEYAELLHRQGRVAEAKPLEQHALAIRKETKTHNEHVGTAVLIKK